MTHVAKLIERIESKQVLEHLQQRAKESKASLAAWAARRIAAKVALDAQIGLLDQLMDAVIADATQNLEPKEKRKAKVKAEAKTKEEDTANSKGADDSSGITMQGEGGSGTDDELPAGDDKTTPPHVEESNNG